MSDRPELKMAQMVIPSENMSLSTLQVEDVCTSGPAGGGRGGVSNKEVQKSWMRREEGRRTGVKSLEKDCEEREEEESYYKKEGGKRHEGGGKSQEHMVDSKSAGGRRKKGGTPIIMKEVRRVRRRGGCGKRYERGGRRKRMRMR